jgi:hypothetical protein
VAVLVRPHVLLTSLGRFCRSFRWLSDLPPVPRSRDHRQRVHHGHHHQHAHLPPGALPSAIIHLDRLSPSFANVILSTLINIVLTRHYKRLCPSSQLAEKDDPSLGTKAEAKRVLDNLERIVADPGPAMYKVLVRKSCLTCDLQICTCD